MQEFNKKQSIIFISISAFFLIACTILISFSHEFINTSYIFLSEKVFHRSFDLEKWQPTIESFFLIPLFLLITVNALLFPKFNDKTKVFQLSVFFAAVLFSTLYCIATRDMQHVDTDLASELLLAKECVLEKSFWPKGWNYSTEIRLLNTQLITAPLFLITNNWTIAKAFTSFFSMLFLFFAVYYVLLQLNIKKFWIKYLICILAVLPFSNISWYVGAWGTYYIPHAIFNLIYVGTFIKLIKNKSINHNKATLIFFYIWAFLSGVSSIRYIMIFVFPLALSMIVSKCLEKDSSCTINNFEEFWKNTDSVRISTIGLLLSGAGYVFNNLVLQRIYTFSEWNTIAFCNLGDIKLRDILHSLLAFWGYQDHIAVLTPNGIINLLTYAIIILTAVFITVSLKDTLSKEYKIFLVYFITSFGFNTFVYLHTELIERYYYPILIPVFACFAIILSSSKISNLKKYAFGTILGITIFTSSFTTIQNKLNTDKNIEYHNVVDFLNKNYDFGFASFWNTNVITYMTNGKVEVGNLYRTKENGNEIFTKSFKYATWLTPERYYKNAEKDKDAHIFLLISQAQYKVNSTNKAVVKGKEVYADKYFRVLDYNSYNDFVKSFE